jgi:hypothetical protein
MRIMEAFHRVSGPASLNSPIRFLNPRLSRRAEPVPASRALLAAGLDLWGFLSPVLAVTWVDVVRLDRG